MANVSMFSALIPGLWVTGSNQSPGLGAYSGSDYILSSSFPMQLVALLSKSWPYLEKPNLS